MINVTQVEYNQRRDTQGALWEDYQDAY